MSKDEFLGRVINTGIESHYFELCDICEKRIPNWIETNKIAETAEIRVTCNKCHEDFINALDQHDEIIDPIDYSVYDEVPSENEDITPVERPAWMQEFIDEAEESGAIETIGGSEVAEANIEILGKTDENIEESDSVELIEDEIVNNKNTDFSHLASWSSDFIKEALFGQDPEAWLSEQNAFSPEDINKTIYTLANLSDNQVTNVKITAIHCLNSVNKRYPDLGNILGEALNKFTDDSDEMVVNYANETISALK